MHSAMARLAKSRRCSFSEATRAVLAEWLDAKLAGDAVARQLAKRQATI
jgi:hypothetical protein